MSSSSRSSNASLGKPCGYTPSSISSSCISSNSSCVNDQDKCPTEGCEEKCEEKKSGMKNFWLSQKEKVKQTSEGWGSLIMNGRRAVQLQQGQGIRIITSSGHTIEMNDLISSGTIIDDPIIIPVEDQLNTSAYQGCDFAPSGSTPDTFIVISAPDKYKNVVI